MTKETQLKRKAETTIRHLEALLKLIHSVATGKPAPKVRPERKKTVTRKPLAKKRPEKFAALWDYEP
jgi:hypothetical protein